MARRRIAQVSALTSWADVDKALREIAEEEIALEDIEAELTRQINGAKAVAQVQAKPHADRVAKLERDIQEFADAHREALGSRKTVELDFGRVGYRQSTRITLPRDKAQLAEIIRRLRARKMTDCIAVTETVNKDRLRQYGKDKATAVGAGWRQTDEFWLEAAREKLERLQAGQQ